VLINWFTVIAQIVNFLILVVLLKYLLYNRIIKAMDEREGKIQLHLKEAEEKEQAAEREAESLRQKNRDFDENREKMLAQAKEEADARRKELTQEARLAVTNLRSVWQEAVQREKESFVQDLRKMAATQVYALARKAFEDLADAELGERMVDVFLARIQKIKKKERDALVVSIKEAGNEVVILSAFEITSKMRKKVTQALHRHLNGEITPRYETTPDLIMGIELKTRGRKIAWNLRHYLDTMEENALRTLEQEAERKINGEEKVLPDTEKKRADVKNAREAERQASHKGKIREPEETNEDGAS
jgi:F-type H+-transporting ATPase subunit b